MTPARVSYLSLFVDDLAAAAKRYEALFGVAPSDDTLGAPEPHPFARSRPVVFRLGPVAVALYAADPSRGTNQGDVGIGLTLDAPAEAVTARFREARARSLAPAVVLPDGRSLAVGVLPDNHFVEVVTPKRPEG